MSKLLIDEPPLQVLPSLACRIGLNEAIVLQQLHYWLRESKHLYEGKKWIHNTYEEWQKHFPFFSRETIKRIFISLEQRELIFSSTTFNRVRIDRTKWYTLNYEKLNEITIVQNCTTMRSICTDGEVKLNPSHQVKLTRPITRDRNTTETTTEDVVASQENEKDDDRKTEDIVDIIADTKFQDVISKNAIKEAIDSYRPEAHVNHQPETPAVGVHRILDWMSHVEMPKNPSGFLIDMAKKGMDKPAALIRAEQAAKAKMQEAEKRRREREELEAVKSEREIPPESREFLDRLRGRVAV